MDLLENVNNKYCLIQPASDRASVKLGVPVHIIINIRLASPFRAIHSIVNIWYIWPGIAFGTYTSLRSLNISEFIQTVHIPYSINTHLYVHTEHNSITLSILCLL